MAFALSRRFLKIAVEHELKSIAFCCISTGEFRFPNKEAAEIAIKTVKDFIAESQSEIKVVFNVFKDMDYEIYRAFIVHLG
ncbi:MAG: macro domain-containing protein [Syntrophobacterales bacterium]|nr:macro domain-containing protein [Syntrophobacterales bacterium]